MRPAIGRRWRFLAAALLVGSLDPAAQASQPANPAAPGSNIAMGAPYVLSPAPNYAHCTDPGDAMQLTDGRLTEGHFWTQQGTVGWQSVNYATITIDLGKDQPVAGVSFRTAAGTAGVSWPPGIRIHVSVDGKSYGDVGDLLELDDSARNLPSTYAVRRLATSRLRTHGRYVRLLAIPAGPYLFVDEIEVLRGDDSFLELEPATRPAADIEETYLRYRVESGIRRRFNADAAGIEQAVRKSRLDAAARDLLLERLAEVREKLAATVSRDSLRGFRTILPFNDAHAHLFRIQAAAWKAAGQPALSAWGACPWDPLDPYASPRPSAINPIEVHTLRGEYRSAAFNLANATDAPLRVDFRITGLPGAPTPSFMTSYRVPWTDTVTGQPVAAALVEFPPREGGWTVQAPPGLVQQIWLTFHVTDLESGQYTGSIVIRAPGAEEISLPLYLRVYPLDFPARTTLWLGGWSYTDGPGQYGITPANHKPFVEHLRAHFVNAPWASSQVMMRFSFKDAGDPRVELDTRRFDDWLAQWPGARTYLVFAAVEQTFAGTQMGTEAFNERVGQWISAWVRHLAGKGITPDRLGLLLVDEPRAQDQDETIIAWAKAIHAAEPQVLIWEDPIYPNPKEGKPEMFELCNVLCPNRPMWLAGGEAFEAFYRDQQKRGRTLQFYSCSGPARLLDPYAYYRLQAWHCWEAGATGSFFWAFGDNSGISSWNEYAAAAGPYTPLFLDDQSVTPAKQMEAIRESVEDYEYFVLLGRLVQAAAAERSTHPALTRARSLLQHAADEVLAAEGTQDLNWHAPKDRTRADRVRVQLLEALSELAATVGKAETGAR